MYWKICVLQDTKLNNEENMLEMRKGTKRKANLCEH